MVGDIKIKEKNMNNHFDGLKEEWNTRIIEGRSAACLGVTM